MSTRWLTTMPRGDIIFEEEQSVRSALLLKPELQRLHDALALGFNFLLMEWNTTWHEYRHWFDYDHSSIYFPNHVKSSVGDVTKYILFNSRFSLERVPSWTIHADDDHNYDNPDSDSTNCLLYIVCQKCYFDWFALSNPGETVSLLDRNNLFAEDNIHVIKYSYSTIYDVKQDLYDFPSRFWCNLCFKPTFQLYHDKIFNQVIWPNTNNYLNNCLSAERAIFNFSGLHSNSGMIFVSEFFKFS